jgi:hypothetical protein
VQVLEEKMLQLGVTSRRVLGLCLGISWLNSALLFPSEGVEEDLLLCLWCIYIEEFLLCFLPHEGFPRYFVCLYCFLDFLSFSDLIYATNELNDYNNK